MAQADENGVVSGTFALVFTGMNSDGKPNFYVVEGDYWKPGGKDVNGPALPEGWLVLDAGTTVGLQVPADFNPMAAAIASLDEEIQSVRAAAELKVRELLQKKNDLLMLGHSAPTEAFPDIPF